MTLLMFAAFAGDGLTTGTERQQLAIQRCLKNWGEHPFTDETPKFKEAQLTVRVLQFGDVQEIDSPTTEPQLVYIEPNVNVLSKVKYRLANPNGWYCFNNNVDVLSKIRFEMQCDAKLASSRDGATVMGADEAGKGVTVLGSVRVERVCDPKPKAEPERPQHFIPGN